MKSSSETKRCAECGPRSDSPTFDISTENGRRAVLEHYLEEHPGSSGLAEVIEGSFVRRECNDCGRPFWAVAHLGHNGDGRATITAEAFCPDCEGDDPIRQLLVETVPPQTYVMEEGEPFEDDLDRETVTDIAREVSDS